MLDIFDKVYYNGGIVAVLRVERLTPVRGYLLCSKYPVDIYLIFYITI